MKENTKDIIILTFFSLILIGILSNYTIIIDSIKSSTEIWLFKLFPSLFPFLVIGSILINYNLSNYLGKIFKSNKSIITILSLISGFPSNAKYTKEMYLNNQLSLSDANNVLCYSFFSNPLFLLSTLSTTFSKKITILIIMCHYISNFILFLFLKDKSSNSAHTFKSKENLSIVIAKSIKDSINTLLLILGTITFYNIIISLIKIYINNNILISLITGILEFSQGLISLNTLNIDLLFKAYLALLFISFGSLSIHTQIKSILLDTPIKFKKFFIFRIFHSIISMIIFTLIYFLM